MNGTHEMASARRTAGQKEGAKEKETFTTDKYVSLYFFYRTALISLLAAKVAAAAAERARRSAIRRVSGIRTSVARKYRVSIYSAYSYYTLYTTESMRMLLFSRLGMPGSQIFRIIQVFCRYYRVCVRSCSLRRTEKPRLANCADPAAGRWR